MLMSSRIRSGGSRRAASSASLPPGTGRTRYPRSLSMPASTWRLAGVSSTARMLAGWAASRFGVSGINAGSRSRTVDDPTAPRGAPGETMARGLPESSKLRSRASIARRRRHLFRQGFTGTYRSRAPGGRVPLPQCDPVALLVVFDLIHEGTDEHKPTPTDPLEVGRVRRVGHRGAVEAGPLVLDDVDGLQAGQRGPDMDPPVPVGRLPSPFLAEVPEGPLVLLAEFGVELQVAVLDGVQQGLVQGDPDTDPFGAVAGVQERGDLLQVAEQRRDLVGVVVEDEAELAIGQAVERPLLLGEGAGYGQDAPHGPDDLLRQAALANVARRPQVQGLRRDALAAHRGHEDDR